MKKERQGLTTAEVRRSKELYGDNSLLKRKSKGFIGKFFENLSDPIVRVLLIALIFQILLTLGNCNYFEIFGILSAILISTTVSTVSEYRSERAFERLESENRGSLVNVQRDGVLKKILPSELVVGDIVYISAGERIHADGTVIEGRISVDQSALNGESREVEKRVGSADGWDLDSECRLFRGSLVTEGACVMLVGRVGVSTYYGKISEDVQAEPRTSPLKLRLRRLAKQVSRIGYVIAAIVGAAYIFRTIIIDNSFDGDKIISAIRDYKYLFSVLLSALTYMITVIVVAAPEGLPMMITVVLSANMKKMLSDQIHVKKLVGIDTAGSLNILFTDKTGTLTEGKLLCDRIITADGCFRGISTLERSGSIYSALVKCAKYNTEVSSVGGELTGGNSTDRAIYSFFEAAELPECTVVEREPFSSERKYSSVTLGTGEKIIKGAAEYILDKVSFILKTDGGYEQIDKQAMLSEFKHSAENGERMLAVAINNGEHEQAALVGLIVLKDKIRRGVKKSVQEVQRAGIQVVMITGDSKETAVSIAKECGIMSPTLGHIALSADDLHRIGDYELKELLPRIRVIARALPSDKTRLVRISQELGLVVGMTGDGINDAPSLKLADVGFAMGSGAEIAKTASDIVILDNSFSAIDKTVLYGRTIFKSIRKFISFQLIMNLAACGISLLGQFIGLDTPITIIQMLWVNIIMDTLGGLAFAGEPPLDYYMKEMPIKRDEPILSRSMLGRIFILGAFTLGLCTLFLTSPIFKELYGYNTDPTKFYTAFYALFIFSGIFICFATRCDRVWLLSNIGKNRPFALIMLCISVIQIFMIYFGGELFRCTPLSAKELLFAVSLAFSIIPFDIARRIINKFK